MASTLSLRTSYSNTHKLTVIIKTSDNVQVQMPAYGLDWVEVTCYGDYTEASGFRRYYDCRYVRPDDPYSSMLPMEKFFPGASFTSVTIDVNTWTFQAYLLSPRTAYINPKVKYSETVQTIKCDGTVTTNTYNGEYVLTKSELDSIYNGETVTIAVTSPYSGQVKQLNVSKNDGITVYSLGTSTIYENDTANTYPNFRWQVRLKQLLPDNSIKIWGTSDVQYTTSQTVPGGTYNLNFDTVGKAVVDIPTTTLQKNYCTTQYIDVLWQPPIKPLKVGVALRHVKERSLYGEATKSVRYGPISLRGKIKAENRLKIKSVDVKAKINREKKKQLTQSMIQKITRDISNSKPIQSSTILWGDFSIPVPEIEVFPIDWLTTASDLSETTRSRIDRRRYQNVVISEVRSLVRTIPTFNGEPMKFGSFAGVEFPLDTPEYIEIVDYFVYLFKPWSGTDTVFYDPFLPSDRWIGDIIDVTQFVKTVHRLPYRGETNVQSIKTNIPNFDTQSFNAPDDFTVGVVFIVKPKMGHAIYNRLYYLDDEVVKNVNLELSVVNDWYWLIRSKPTGMGLAFYPVYLIDEYADAFERLANEHEFYQYIFAGVPEYSVKFEKVIRQKRLPVMLWFLSNYFTIGQNIEGWLRTPSSRIVLLPNQKAQIKIGSETYYGGDSLIAGALIFNWYKELFMNNKVKTEFMPIVRITQAERIDMPNSLVKVGHTYGYGQLVTSDNNFSMNYYFMSFVDYITFRIYRELKNRFSGNPYDVAVKSIIGRGLSEDDIRSLIEQIMNEIVLQVETEWNIEIKEIDVDKTGVTLNLSINEQNFALNL